VDSRCERVLAPLEGLGLPAELGVPLENENAVAALGERRRGGEAPDPGADDDRVEVPGWIHTGPPKENAGVLCRRKPRK
jgi:hypothetical protein